MPFKLSFHGQKWISVAFWIQLFWLSAVVDAGTVTVDDADSAISYSGAWQNGNGCSSCWAHPDAGQAHGGTWHDAGFSATTDRAFEFTFRGTQMNIYGIIADFSDTQTQPNVPGFTTYIDGTSTGNIVRTPSRSNTYQYNVAMAQITGLSDSTHTLRIEVMAGRTFLFDYLEYTTVDAAPSNTASSTSTDTSTTSGLTTSGTQSSSTGSTSGTATGPSASGQPNPNGGNNNGNQQNTVGVDAPVGDGNTSTSGSTSKGLNTSSVIGISFGAVALIVLVLFFVLMRRRHNRRLKARSSYTDTGMFAPSTDGTSTINPFTIPETSANSVIVNRSPRLSSDGRLTTEESSQRHPDGAWLQMVGLGAQSASNDALPGAPSTLIVPRPMRLNAARHELNMQQEREQRRRQNANNGDQDDDELSYIRTPPMDGRATASSIQAGSIRAMTAPPPYVRSPPIGMPPVIDHGEDAPDYRA
ncbi:hypothetical protein CPB86DRAFT_873475 [Serendipita vermifera]|nr:hypothetical protein CPB86DRAFT_873475 [Serendipita vermifera]